MIKEARREKIHRYLPRVLCILVTAAYVCFIFGNSLDTAEESSEKSGIVTKLIQTAVNTVLPGISIEEGTVRKLAHFAEFAVLGFADAVRANLYEKIFAEYIYTAVCLPCGRRNGRNDTALEQRQVFRGPRCVN